MFPHHQCGDSAAVWLRNDGLNWVGIHVSGKRAVGGEEKKTTLIKIKKNASRALIETHSPTPVSERKQGKLHLICMKVNFFFQTNDSGT